MQAKPPPVLPSTASPRDRIMATAIRLFYREGIQSTGVAELADAAGVSKRTLYQLFGSKDELIAAYLQQMDGGLVRSEQPLFDVDRPPRERLLAIFDRPEAGFDFRGCPFHNAAVEISSPDHPAVALIRRHKQEIQSKITENARAAGAQNPAQLGRELTVLFEGATSLARSIGSTESFDYARPVAQLLLAQALPATTRGRRR